MQSSNPCWRTAGCTYGGLGLSASSIISREHGLLSIRKVQYWKDNTDWATSRNNKFTEIQRFGRAIWKCWSGYHQRNLIKIAMPRFKRLGERLHALNPAQPAAEVYVRCVIRNRWTHLGMPITVPRP